MHVDSHGNRKGPFQPLSRAAAVLAVAFILLQFIRPELTNPRVTADLQAPPEVKQIIKTSCYNCHSNETKLSWFDWPVPAYWLVAKDVKAARARLNFSEIGMLPPAQQKGILYESVSQIMLGAMPLPDYQRLHRESAITPQRLQVLKDYLHAGDSSVATSEPSPAANNLALANAQYAKWLTTGNRLASGVKDAPNGIAFLPDYKNWHTVSSTERFDNNTLRVILGNDVAIKAIAENHINPWPDGTAFAKVAWEQQRDSNGMVRSGAFVQVEFMIRDSVKYAPTKGWGWARWRGTDLTPYGKDAEFTSECVGCHAPVRKNDYVFTYPLRRQQ